MLTRILHFVLLVLSVGAAIGAPATDTSLHDVSFLSLFRIYYLILQLNNRVHGVLLGGPKVIFLLEISIRLLIL